MPPTKKEYALDPTAFQSMRDVQGLTDVLEENLRDHAMGSGIATDDQ